MVTYFNNDVQEDLVSTKLFVIKQARFVAPLIEIKCNKNNKKI